MISSWRIYRVKGHVTYSDETQWVIPVDSPPVKLFECRVGFDKKGLPGILDIEVCNVFCRSSISRNKRVEGDFKVC